MEVEVEEEEEEVKERERKNYYYLLVNCPSPPNYLKFILTLSIPRELILNYRFD